MLLDTHTLLWAAMEPEKLSHAACSAIEDEANDVYVSAVSAMEIATKVRAGKLDIGRPLAANFVGQIEARGFRCLSITALHGQIAGTLPIAHKDPWDRLLIAQTQVDRLLLVTNDTEVRRFCESTFW